METGDAMTSPNLLPDLKRDEGLRLAAYPDPLSHGPPWTIGYGHTGPDVHEGLVWTEDQADAALQADVDKATNGLDEYLPWWRTLDDIRQDCLVNMAFNMGAVGLAGFHTFLGLVRSGDFAAAADDLQGTLWARQVGGRAERVVQEIRTGVHAD